MDKDIDSIDLEYQTEEDEIPDGPKVGVDMGVAGELIALIKDEWEAIEGYNNFKMNLGSHSEFINLIDDIVAEENNHIGMLQKMLETISPNVENIAQGQEEAKLDLDETDFDF